MVHLQLTWKLFDVGTKRTKPEKEKRKLLFHNFSHPKQPASRDKHTTISITTTTSDNSLLLSPLLMARWRHFLMLTLQYEARFPQHYFCLSPRSTYFLFLRHIACFGALVVWRQTADQRWHIITQLYAFHRCFSSSFVSTNPNLTFCLLPR